MKWILSTSSAFLVLLFSCKKNHVTPAGAMFKDYTDSFNYIVVDRITYYHMMTAEKTQSYEYKDWLGYPKWWNTTPYKTCYVNMTYGPLQQLSFLVVSETNDTLTGTFSKAWADAIKYSARAGRMYFTYDSLKIYTNSKDSSQVIFVSGQSSHY